MQEEDSGDRSQRKTRGETEKTISSSGDLKQKSDQGDLQQRNFQRRQGEEGG